MKKYATFTLMLLTYNFAQASEGTPKSNFNLQLITRVEVLEQYLKNALSKTDARTVENLVKENSARLAVLKNHVNQQNAHEEALKAISKKVGALELDKLKFENSTQKNFAEKTQRIATLEAAVATLTKEVQRLISQQSNPASSKRNRKRHNNYQ